MSSSSPSSQQEDTNSMKRPRKNDNDNSNQEEEEKQAAHPLRSISLPPKLFPPLTPLPLQEKEKKVIGTHSGTFQADEALGVWLLRQTATYRDSAVVRTRDPEVYKKLDIVIDVGGVYDHEKRRYDHHQRGYDETFHENGGIIKLSASGLVYRHYGKDVIRAYYPDMKDEDLDVVYDQMYMGFMEAIDAIDTGVELTSSGSGGDDTMALAYRDSTNLSSRIGRLNPRWNHPTASSKEQDELFEIASSLCGQEFLWTLSNVVECDLPAQSLVERAMQKRVDIDPSGQIIVFESGGMPWREHLYRLERLHNIDPLIKFVLFTDQNGMWRVQAVTVEGKKFVNRLSLPEEWRGLRDEVLVEVSGIKGCRFCHAAGFIGGNDEREGALEMARFALRSGGKE